MYQWAFEHGKNVKINLTITSESGGNMNKYQIINDCGMTIDIIEAITPSFAIEKARGKRNQLSSDYDKYWQIENHQDYKINLKRLK